MQNTLLLVDGSSYLYRAFHALPDLRSPKGEPTGALYGIISMLRKLKNDYPASYLACIFDAKGKTFRNDLYADYKANRSEMPEALQMQIAPIHIAVRALGWPLIMIDGVEADDVIGTLAVQASAQGLHTIVSTGDKDLAQLVNDRVTLINTMTNEKMDRAGVQNKFGVPPERIVDYLTLIGDAVDNIPGVMKVGPKTALKWLAEYDDLAGVIAHASEIGGVVGQNLRDVLAWLPQAQELLKVKLDCDLSQQVESIQTSLQGQAPDQARLLELFQQYGFKTWSKELMARAAAKADAANTADATPTAAPAFAAAAQTATPGLFDAPAASAEAAGLQTATQYETILRFEQLDAWLDQISQAAYTCIQSDTTSLDPMRARLVGLSLCCEPGRAAYIPLAHTQLDDAKQLPLADVLKKLQPWLENANQPKLGHNLNYIAHTLENHGVHLRGITHDTLLASYVLESHKSHSLESMAERHLQRKIKTFEDLCGKGVAQIGFDQVPIPQAAVYAAENADVTLQLHQTLWPQIERDAGLLFIYRQIELPTSSVLHIIERTGVLIDAQLLARQSLILGSQLHALEQQAHALAQQTFNLNSPKQIGEIFFQQLQLPVIKKTASGAPSTDEEVLQKLAENYPLPKIVLEYRSLAKLKSTYIDKLPRMINPDTGRVHTNYAQAVAVTGRLSSLEPNLQNIPIRHAEGRKIREAFIAAPEHAIISADYSQIELRIMAHISEEPNLVDAFASHEDVHCRTAAEIFGIAPDQVSADQRRVAKTINFGLIYGMSAFGLASNLGIERHAAQTYIERYFTRYPHIAQYMSDTRAQAKAQGYVETVFGRRLWLPEINSPNGPRRQAAERAAINAPMQGTAADLIKLAMIVVQNWLEQNDLKSRLIMQVHDELVFEVPLAEEARLVQELPQLMCNLPKLKVPLVVEVGVGANWDCAH